jgi:putative acetyltransferase
VAGAEVSLRSNAIDTMRRRKFVIEEADPSGFDASVLLRLAAIEARQTYPELFSIHDPWPTNEPTAARGVYLLAYRGDRAIGMGAHRPIDAVRTELRRMYVLRDERQRGAAGAILARLEQHAADHGFEEVVLETGYKQESAMRLYEARGYRRIEAFGPYIGDPTSVCFAKPLAVADEPSRVEARVGGARRMVRAKPV